METIFVVRACCADRADAASGYITPADDEFIARGPVLESGVMPPARSLSVAIHEAGHAVIAIALGGRCTDASCIAPAHATTPGLDAEARIITTLAGEIAENWQRRTVYRPADAAILPWLRMIRSPGGGHCDGCKVLRGCTILSGHGTDEEVLVIFRRLETEVIRLVQTPAIWAAIRDLAAALLIAGTLDEAEINASVSRHVRPGEFSLSSSAQE